MLILISYSSVSISLDDGTYDTVANVANLVNSALASSDAQNQHHPATTTSTPALPPRSPATTTAADAAAGSSPGNTEPTKAVVLRRPVIANHHSQDALNETGLSMAKHPINSFSSKTS